MSHAEILERAVQKAIEGGWKPDSPYPKALLQHMAKLQAWDGLLWIADHDDGINVEAVIFNHDFAKALWGDDWDATSTQPNWHYHLQQMVIAEDSIKYLAEHLPDDPAHNS